MAIPLRPRPVEEGGFARFTGKGTKHRVRTYGAPLVHMRDTGALYLNIDAVDMLPAGNFPYVELYFNVATTELGFRPLSTLPANEKHPKFCHVKGGGRSFSARSLLRQYDIPLCRATYPMRFDQALCLYIIDLTKEVL